MDLLKKAITGFYLLCITAFLAAIAYHHALLVSHHQPLDYNEPGMLVITATILEGSGPFALENQPSRISLYPVLYNHVVAPFAGLLGNTLELHRAVAGFFIVASCVLCYYLCRRQSVTRTDSLAAASILYAALLYYSTPIASPNSLGLFLFLGAIALPWLRGFSNQSLAAALVLGMLAFYTKQYFIACLGFIALYLLLSNSKKRAVLFGLSGLAVLIASLVIVNQISPYFLANTIFAVRASAEAVSADVVVAPQFSEYAEIYYPLLVVLAVATWYRFRPGRAASEAAAGRSASLESSSLLDLDRPLLAKQVDYFWLCCACSIVIIVLALGRNPGNHLTYLLQLISPFLLIGTFAMLARLPIWHWLLRALIVLTLYNSYAVLHRDFTINEENWTKIRDEIALADDLYATTLLIPDILGAGKTAYQNGHTPYFVFGTDTPPFLMQPAEEERVNAIWERHVRQIESKVRNREFDLILLDNWMRLPQSITNSGADPNAVLRANYEQTGKILLQLVERPGGGAYMVRIFKPREAARTATGD